MARLERWSDPHRVAAVLGLAIATLVVLGAVFAWRSESVLSPFDLDGERNVPALFSALLLLACAVLAFRLPGSVVPRAVALVFSGVLVLASLDEATEIHEKLEQRLEVDWQLLYIPVFVAAVAVWSLLVAGLRRNGFSLTPVLASAGCWIASQALEALQWEDEGPAPGYTWMMVVEETLEMTGSALLLVGLLVVGRERRVDE
jgi:phosphate/sulfate permease